MNFMNDVFREQGRKDALALRAEANTLTGTQIIDREAAIPAWSHSKDYSSWPAGSPVSDEGQIWKLITPHNAAYYAERPSSLRALWSLCHTTDPNRAKPWVTPMGTSGMYMRGECYKDNEGIVYVCKNDNTVHSAQDYPAAWDAVTV